MNEPVDKLTFSCDLIVEQQKRIAELDINLASANRALHAVIGIPASVGICEPIEGYKAAPNFLPSAIKGMAKMIAELEKNLGLIKLGIEQQHEQLISCETALDERNDKVSLQASMIAELELFLDRMLEIEHSRGGSLDVSGQFMYKTPESIFKQAKQLREGVK